MSCADVGKEAVRISKGELVAINHQSSTTRTDQQVTCHGTALTSNGREVPVRFVAFRGDDGSTFVKYDSEEYEQALADQAKRDGAREEAEADAAAQKEWREAMDEARYQAAVDAAPR